ncbi:MAG: DUF4199 domain-containing protein [Acidobacteriota bacterium]|nr:DUF4199 domain-containing protein [Acidobacteriota bacterium]MDH3784389.1 DUF4199 domain-containing protein [Acidobacteriota bacterium]
MSAAVKGGLGLGIAVVVFNLIFLGAGMHRNPLLGFLAIAIYIGLTILFLVLALRKSRTENPYLKQVMSSVVLGVVAAVIITIGSIVLTTMVFPDSIQQQSEATLEFLEGANLPQEALDAQIEKLESLTANGQAIQGGIFTIITCLVVGLIAAIFVRKK